MRTTTLTVLIEARANASESRIHEAVLQQVQDAFAHGHGRATEDGRPVRVRIAAVAPARLTQATALLRAWLRNEPVAQQTRDFLSQE